MTAALLQYTWVDEVLVGCVWGAVCITAILIIWDLWHPTPADRWFLVWTGYAGAVSSLWIVSRATVSVVLGRAEGVHRWAGLAVVLVALADDLCAHATRAVLR
ncbi:hypothetical protein T484DRAFT_1764004, partial [Baffinella frigidus]